MAAALVLLAILYFPLPVALVMAVVGITGSWFLGVGAVAGLVAFACYLPSLSERIALASRARRSSLRATSPS